MAPDINQMTKKELTSLKGVTDQIADAIIARRSNAPFTSLDELTSLPGLDHKIVTQLKKQDVSCLPPADEANETFVCRSCGRELPVSEQEKTNNFNQHICNACYANMNLWTMPKDGA